MRLLLTLREINWLSVAALLLAVAAPIVAIALSSGPSTISLTLSGSAICLAVLAIATRD
jgi:hypothetical protein